MVFVDVVDDFVTLLNARAGVPGDDQDEHAAGDLVRNVRAVTGKMSTAVAEALAEADIAATSVGPNALPYLYPAIAPGCSCATHAMGCARWILSWRRICAMPPSIVRTGLRQRLPERFSAGGHARAGGDEHRQNGADHDRGAARGRSVVGVRRSV